MASRLILTAEEIEEANRLAQGNPDVIRISPGDLPPDIPPRGTTAVLRVTLDDITAVLGTDPTPDIQQLERLMWQLINEARQAHSLARLLGRHTLYWHDALAAVARTHAQDMLRRHYVEHITPEGITAVQRIQRASIGYMACGENIGVVYGHNSHTQAGVNDIHNAFLNQPRGRVNNHRGNLLNPFWTHVGVGIAYSPHGALFATQNFIAFVG